MTIVVHYLYHYSKGLLLWDFLNVEWERESKRRESWGREGKEREGGMEEGKGKKEGDGKACRDGVKEKNA